MCDVVRWTTKTTHEEWEVEAINGRVVITQYAGPFRLPSSRVTIDGAIAHTIAKDLRAAQKLARNQVRE